MALDSVMFFLGEMKGGHPGECLCSEDVHTDVVRDEVLRHREGIRRRSCVLTNAHNEMQRQPAVDGEARPRPHGCFFYSFCNFLAGFNIFKMRRRKINFLVTFRCSQNFYNHFYLSDPHRPSVSK